MEFTILSGDDPLPASGAVAGFLRFEIDRQIRADRCGCQPNDLREFPRNSFGHCIQGYLPTQN